MQFDEIQEIFFQECEEGLVAAEAGLLLCKSGTQDDDTINTIFRAVHSIKGGAGAFGFNRLQAFTHKFETLLDQVRSGELALDAALVGTLLRAFDMLSDHVAAIRGQASTPDDAEMIDILDASVQGSSDAAAAPPEPAPAPVAEAPLAPAADPDALDFNFDDLMASLDGAEVGESTGPIFVPDAMWTLEVRPGKAALANGGEPMLLIRELLNLGALMTATDMSAIPPIDAYDPDEAYLGWTFAIPTRVSEAEVREIFDFVLDSCDLLVTREDGADDHHDDELHDLVNAGEYDPEPMPEALAPAPVIAAAAPAAPPAEAEPAPAAAAVAAAAAPAPQGGGQAIAVGGQTIRVDLEKLDRLINLVGELVITQAMLAQKLSLSGLASLVELNDLDQLTRELQDSAMSIRAQPIKSVFSRVPRIVRELEGETGKLVKLEIEGEMTELDKTVVERIGEPLTHLIRNAIDHGLELPDVRVAAGKPPAGTVRLTAEHKGGRILICVSDDGGGINRVRVKQKAIERGLIAAEAQLTDEEIDNLVFAPGFSTAETVSNISGRGVGMDVVRRNVEALGGRISIQSRPGQGSTFTLALPLTLAILDGMIVSVGEQTYVIPLTHIVESLRPQESEVTSMGNGRSMLNVRGTFLPIEPIGHRLAVDGAETDPTKAVLIVVESDASGRSVLMVDAIRDQRQVVIKSLETHYKPVRGLAGATILGDGRVALILDVEMLVSHHGRVRLAA